MSARKTQSKSAHDVAKAEQIIDAMDRSRLDTYGGYPSDWAIFRGMVVMASVDHNDAPELTIQKVRDFIKDNSEWIEVADKHMRFDIANAAVMEAKDDETRVDALYDLAAVVTSPTVRDRILAEAREIQLGRRNLTQDQCAKARESMDSMKKTRTENRSDVKPGAVTE